MINGETGEGINNPSPVFFGVLPSKEENKMENLNVWIHCRVSAERSKDVLDYQENELKLITDDFDMCVVGITRQVSNGKELSSFGMQQLITAIKHGKVDVVLVYSYKRITVDEDLLEEFLMFCQMYNVRVWALSDVENFYSLTE